MNVEVHFGLVLPDGDVIMTDRDHGTRHTFLSETFCGLFIQLSFLNSTINSTNLIG